MLAAGTVKVAKVDFKCAVPVLKHFGDALCMKDVSTLDPDTRLTPKLTGVADPTKLFFCSVEESY